MMIRTEDLDNVILGPAVVLQVKCIGVANVLDMVLFIHLLYKLMLHRFNSA
jgi:hypothetical protein